MNKKLPSNTAPANRSVWTGVNRKSFEEGIKNLKDRSYILDPRDYTNAVSTRPGYLSYEVERQMADDFAFIIAYTPDARHVSATTVTCNPSGSEFVVRFAANEGIDEKVRLALDDLFEILRLRARNAIRAEECTAQLFTTILKLNNKRIRGRVLGRFEEETLSVRFRNLVEAHVRELRSSTQQGKKLMHCDVQNFEKACIALITAKAPNEMEAMKDVVSMAFALTENGRNLCTRLEQLQIPKCRLDTKDVRQVHKLANYLRICQDLTRSCASYRRGFQTMNYEPIAAYRPTFTFGEQFVHAEIQLLVFFELQPDVYKPRVIGASKEACYLCDAFIRAHGKFGVTKAHRQIYPKWTVPDLADYSAATLKRFRKCLRVLTAEVNMERARRRTNVQFPCQSSVNLHLPKLRTPSTSTLQSKVATLRSRASTSESRASTSQSRASPIRPSIIESVSVRPPPASEPASLREPLVDFTVSSAGTSVAPSDTQTASLLPSSELSSVPEEHLVQTRDETMLGYNHRRIDSMNVVDDVTKSPGLKVTKDLHQVEHADWLRVEMLMLDSSSPDISVPSLSGKDVHRSFSTGLLQIEEVLDQNQHLVVVVDLDSIPVHEELVLACNSEGTNLRFDFILRKSPGKMALFQCHWVI